MRKDYYGTLGVDKNASQEEIKRAYRKLARKFHPDVNPGDDASEERFKEISEAYHVLGDSERRQQYDRVGPEAFAQEFDLSDFAVQFSDLFRGGRGFQGGGFGMFEDLLGGGASRGSAPARGRDVRVAVDLNLEQVIGGGEQTISYRRADGAITRTTVRIPSGTRDGTRIRVAGKGEPGRFGGPPGDLLLEVRILPHPVYRLDGDHLRVALPVTLYDAALGATIEVPTPNGTTKIKLPKGTGNGQVFRVRGQGAARKGGGRGDLLATVELAMPPKIDAGLGKLFRTMRDSHPYPARPSSRSSR